MIDFKNPTFVKLKETSPDSVMPTIQPLLMQDENIVSAFQGTRDFIVFTNRRIMSCNVQGLTGKKKDITSLPYGRIQAFSVETAGTLDRDSELELWFSGVGSVKFEFSGNVNIAAIGQIIGFYVLK